MNCKDCRFFRPNTFEGAKTGDCRRYPPQVNHTVSRDGYGLDIHTNEAFFPDVSEDEWCGEFKETEDELLRKKIERQEFEMECALKADKMRIEARAKMEELIDLTK